MWIMFHAVPPFFAFAVLPEKASCPIPAACSGVGALYVSLPQLGYAFSDGHSIFKVLSIDELP
ncbi:hypothetical protein K170097C1_29710 [Hungatella effluvii]|jgi:hypothetical protein|uniref:hypothetical protein n=1 Tax=Eisenbergiella sp. TaxID=1924109 RepID=UPI002A2543D7|nr:hypothetical protein [Lachnospiraceae bacterium]